MNRYSAIIANIFEERYNPGDRIVYFERDDINGAADNIGVARVSNLGDLIYYFRYRSELPLSIRTLAPEGEVWIIRSAGPSKYQLELVTDTPRAPSPNLAVTKVPDSTPGVIAKYAFSDEQAVLARVRYNRLVDIFLGITCYSLQNHLRTTASDLGQVEIDEIYIGVDKRGSHYIVPVQAKGSQDRLHQVQLEQDIAVCREKHPALICRSVGTQFLRDDVIVMFEFEQDDDGVRVVAEKHYQLVPPNAVTDEDLFRYRQRLAD